MGARAAASFVVPTDDVRWCGALATALSICCAAPSRARVSEVAALLAAPPEQMVPETWVALAAAAGDWLAAWIADATDAPCSPFPYREMLKAALRDKPVPMARWQEWYP